MKPSKQLSGSSYTIDNFVNIVGSSFNQLHVLDYNRYRPSDPHLDEFLRLSSAFCFVIDFLNMKIIYMSENVKQIMGYEASDWISKGIEFNFTLYHPDDIIAQKALHEDLFAFHAGLPLEEKHLYRYSHDFRVKKSNGEYIRALHQSTIPEIDGKGKPLISFIIMKDITTLKADTTQQLLIDRYCEEKGFQPVFSKAYPVKTTAVLSKRELHILHYMVKGYSSKQIADKLHVSVHTVNTHRSNILAKTGTKNTAGLISYAARNGLM